jgi:hypothetical protein
MFCFPAWGGNQRPIKKQNHEAPNIYPDSINITCRIALQRVERKGDPIHEQGAIRGKMGSDSSPGHLTVEPDGGFRFEESGQGGGQIRQVRHHASGEVWVYTPESPRRGRQVLGGIRSKKQESPITILKSIILQEQAMETVPDKKKRKRLSPGKRKHIRRVKQEARKEGVSEAELQKRLRGS